ncbi:MAG: thioredoxin domain-containing protein [Sphingomonas sp.]|uniref:DsbA family protein n=1 Tax=Sphingomonas sp. TaxID=28214 RepID=UPI0025E4609D|nr:thioredoxin domain-containing protein [Sphingomonas sp.]MBX3565679.1 thioredoxin domain-containing protein [Sphingomonas sp.]
MRFALALTSLLALAACGGDNANNSAPTVSSTAVAPAPAPTGQAWTDVVAKTPEGGYVQGNPNAAIKLVEYGSRNCPVCGRFAAEGIEPLRSKYISTGKVSYEFRDFMVHGAPDLAAALLNQCVPAESFFNVLDQLFAGQAEFEERLMNTQRTNPQVLTQLQQLAPAQQAAGFADLMGYVEFMKQRGVPEAKARTCLADQKAIESIAKVNADAVNQNLPGTPTFLINGKVVPNTASWGALEPALQAAGAR